MRKVSSCALTPFALLFFGCHVAVAVQLEEGCVHEKHVAVAVKNEQLPDFPANPPDTKAENGAQRYTHEHLADEKKDEVSYQEVETCKKELYSSASVDEYELDLKQAKAKDPFVAQMASISNRINDLLPTVSNFQLVKKWDVGATESDNCDYVQYAGIYRLAHFVQYENLVDVKGPCVLAFSSMDLSRSGNRSEIFGKDNTVNWCGFDGVHEGYAERARHFQFGKRFNEFDEFIRGHCDNLALVGHSTGGAIATLVAACAYKANSPWGWPEDPHIYTFGAPAVATDRIKGTQPDVFKGYRVFNQDEAWRDPIPALSRKAGFRHPKLSAFRISEEGFGAKNMHFFETDGGSELSATIPDYDSPWLTDFTVGVSRLHGANIYVKRLLKLCGIRNRRKEKVDQRAKRFLPDNFCDSGLRIF